MANVLAYNSGTLTLAAGVAQNVDVDLKGATRVAILIKNLGVTNSIGTVAVTKYVNAVGGLSWTDSTLGSAIGSIAASGTCSLVELTDVGYQAIRIALTSASGTTARVEIAGNA